MWRALSTGGHSARGGSLAGVGWLGVGGRRAGLAHAGGACLCQNRCEHSSWRVGRSPNVPRLVQERKFEHHDASQPKQGCRGKYTFTGRGQVSSGFLDTISGCCIGPSHEFRTEARQAASPTALAALAAVSFAPGVGIHGHRRKRLGPRRQAICSVSRSLSFVGSGLRRPHRVRCARGMSVARLSIAAAREFPEVNIPGMATRVVLMRSVAHAAALRSFLETRSCAAPRSHWKARTSMVIHADWHRPISADFGQAPLKFGQIRFGSCRVGPDMLASCRPIRLRCVGHFGRCRQRHRISTCVSGLVFATCRHAELGVAAQQCPCLSGLVTADFAVAFNRRFCRSASSFLCFLCWKLAWLVVCYDPEACSWRAWQLVALQSL